MNTAIVEVGRLLEIRSDTAYRTIVEVDAMFERIAAERARHPQHDRFVVAVDWRRCPLMSSEASDRHMMRMRQANPRVERSATLMSRQAPSAMLQFERLIRSSQHENRRLFEDADEMSEWLSEVLTPAESDRLRQFLAPLEPNLGQLEQPNLARSRARS